MEKLAESIFEMMEEITVLSLIQMAFAKSATDRLLYTSSAVMGCFDIVWAWENVCLYSGSFSA